MNPRTTLLALALTIAGAHSARAQETPAPKSRSEILQAAKDVMVKARFCGLITTNGNEPPQARVVDIFPPESDMTVWIGTNPLTRKVAEIGRDDRATILCISPDGNGYVTLIGHAAVVRDSAEKAKRWKPDWAAFYKDENRGDDYVLIRMRPHHLEIMSMPHGIVTTDPKTWRPVSVDLHE